MLRIPINRNNCKSDENRHKDVTQLTVMNATVRLVTFFQPATLSQNWKAGPERRKMVLAPRDYKERE